MNNKKITFIGDVTCDRPLLNAARKRPGKYEFGQVFSQVKSLFEESDYVIGNLETVCAGDKNDFRDQFMLCNTPDQLIYAIKEAGIQCMTTANNHCMDQGIKGLKRTVELLDKNGIEHTGTYCDKEESNKILYKTFDDLKIAILAYTYDTNATNIDVVLNDKNDFHVGLLKDQNVILNSASGLKKIVFKLTSGRQRRFLKRAMARAKLKNGKAFFSARKDVICNGDTDNKYLDKVKNDICEAKKNADYVFVCPHFGGQFNSEPGAYSDFLIKYLEECGANAVIGNHPHVVQRTVIKDRKYIGAYSIGSFNLSVSADYIVHDALPEYSVAIHFYFNPNNDINKVTFTVLKIVEDESKMITVWPVDKLYSQSAECDRKLIKEDVLKIYNRFTNKSLKEISICKEYELLED